MCTAHLSYVQDWHIIKNCTLSHLFTCAWRSCICLVKQTCAVGTAWKLNGDFGVTVVTEDGCPPGDLAWLCDVWSPLRLSINFVTYMGLSCLVQCHTYVFSIHFECAIVLIFTHNNVLISCGLPICCVRIYSILVCIMPSWPCTTMRTKW